MSAQVPTARDVAEAFAAREPYNTRADYIAALTAAIERDRAATIEACARELEHCAFLMEQEEKPGAKYWRAAARWLRDTRKG